MTSSKLQILMTIVSVALFSNCCVTSNAQEGQPCYAHSVGCMPPYSGTNYETCAVAGTNAFSCEVGTRDLEPTCCANGNQETGVKCASPQQTTTTTTHFYRGISAIDENGKCHCTDLEQQQRDGVESIPVATFDSSGCSPGPYE